MKTKAEVSLNSAQLDIRCHPTNPTLSPQQFTYTVFGPGDEAVPSTTKKSTYLQGVFGRKEAFSSYYWKKTRPRLLVLVYKEQGFLPLLLLSVSISNASEGANQHNVLAGAEKNLRYTLHTAYKRRTW